MVLYLTEDTINEAVSSREVADAIGNRTAVLINYADKDASHTGKRYIEPYVYGETKKGNQCIRAYQYWGDTKRGVPKWKLFRLDRIQSWEPTKNTFEVEPKARGWAAQAFNNADKSMATVYKTVDLGQSPQTDYEQLRAKTRQLKQNKPININNIRLNQSKQSELAQAQRAGNGPVGNDRNTSNETTPPVEPEKKSVKEPLNTDANMEQTIQQQNVNGPITDKNINPQEATPDELMSNDDFRKMLQRNLEITDQEKQRRLNKKRPG